MNCPEGDRCEVTGTPPRLTYACVAVNNSGGKGDGIHQLVVMMLPVPEERCVGHMETQGILITDVLYWKLGSSNYQTLMKMFPHLIEIQIVTTSVQIIVRQ